MVEISKLRQLKYMWTFLNYDTIIQWLFQPPLTQIEIKRKKYRIYSINRPGRLLNFWTLRVGAYLRWALIRDWALIKFSPFSVVNYVYFATKQYMLITKREEVTKQGFCKILSRKLRPRGSLLLEFIHSSGWGGGERLFEFDWEEEGVGAYSRLGAY